MNAPVVSSNGVPMPSAAKAMSSTATRPRSFFGLGSLRGVVKTSSGGMSVQSSAADAPRQRGSARSAVTDALQAGGTGRPARRLLVAEQRLYRRGHLRSAGGLLGRGGRGD